MISSLLASNDWGRLRLPAFSANAETGEEASANRLILPTAPCPCRVRKRRNPKAALHERGVERRKKVVMRGDIITWNLLTTESLRPGRPDSPHPTHPAPRLQFAPRYYSISGQHQDKSFFIFLDLRLATCHESHESSDSANFGDILGPSIPQPRCL